MSGRHVRLPPVPPRLPVKEALRGLRHLLHRGRSMAQDIAPVSRLPEPAADIASVLLRGVDGVAETAEAVASGIARRVLGAGATPTARLADIAAGPDAAGAFAAAAYAGLRGALRALGAPDAWVSETAALAAWAEAGAGPGGDADLAGRLHPALLRAGAMRHVAAPDGAGMAPDAVAQVAAFAALLWLLAARDAEDAGRALEAAVAVAAALERDLAAAGGDPTRLAALFTEFRDHV